MNLRFVEAFYWVASLKSVSRAAEKLCITQSAMSSRVAALEEELGVMLLDRKDKQFRLTTAGARFMAYAERLLATQRELMLEMGASGPDTPPMSLRIGAIESVLHSWLLPWIGELRIEHPELELELSVETTPVLTELMRRGTLDLVFAALPASHESVRTRPLPTMEMAFVGNAQIHKCRRYTLAQLAEFDLLTFQRGSQPHVALMDLLRQTGVLPKRVHAISSISAMTQLVVNGFGIATLPRIAVQRLLQYSELALLRCDQALEPLPVFASYRADPLSMTAETVLNSVFAFLDREVKDRAGRTARTQASVNKRSISRLSAAKSGSPT